MPRILAALVMFIMLIVYYIYKVNQEPAETKVEDKKVETSKIIKIEKASQKVAQKKKPVSQKKKEFYDMMVPSLNEVYDELQEQYVQIQTLMQSNPEAYKIQALKNRYKVKSNEELLVALKPHPKSIAIAQGAMESAWGTSRFFKEANNIFGVWSFNKNDKRIAAGEQRGKTTIWLKKYDSVKESIHDYYLTMSRSKAFTEFKKLNYQVQNQNPYLLVTKLDRYSEKGALYGKELASMISYNDFTSYDEVSYEKPSQKVEMKVIGAVKEVTTDKI